MKIKGFIPSILAPYLNLYQFLMKYFRLAKRRWWRYDCHLVATPILKECPGVHWGVGNDLCSLKGTHVWKMLEMPVNFFISPPQYYIILIWFLFLWKNINRKQHMEERIYLALDYSPLSKEAKGGIWRQELKQRRQRNTARWLDLPLAWSATFST